MTTSTTPGTDTRLDRLLYRVGIVRRSTLHSVPSALTEGVDIPSIDSVLFYNPTSSGVLAAQLIGRALRNPEGDREKVANVIVPASDRRAFINHLTRLAEAAQIQGSKVPDWVAVQSDTFTESDEPAPRDLSHFVHLERERHEVELRELAMDHALLLEEMRAFLRVPS